MAEKKLIVRGARQHNLKNIDVEIPRDKLVVITGLSGSGKSSLAFDTIYAEGQRRYVESLSAYARQFLEQMNKPDVDQIEGLSPAISIEQKNASKNPRSTVATVTEIYDHFRLLFARIGKVYCYACGKPIEHLTVQGMVDQILAMPEGVKFMLIAPIIRERKGEFKTLFDKLRKEGHIRVRVDGKMFDLSVDEPELDRYKKHTIEAIIDRLVVKQGITQRLAEGLELALSLAESTALIETAAGERRYFSEHFACVDCQIAYPEISPRIFSFNAPQGACPDCHGLGMKMYFDPELVVPDENLSLRQGAVRPWHSKSGMIYITWLRAVVEAMNGDLDVPWKKLTSKLKQAILYGTNGQEIHIEYESERHSVSTFREFEGVINNLERRYRETQSEMIREELERYMNYRICPTCNGNRLRPEALSVRVGNYNIIDLTRLSIARSELFFETLKLDEREAFIAGRLLKEIRERIGFLNNVGLGYLTLDRASATLSGGEAQRIRLATQIGSSLVGVLYILDEPSIGLHQRDNDRLLKTLVSLRDLGNTVIVVEHDEDTILAADHVIDIGPGAGVHGGEIIAQGAPETLVKEAKSLTARYLAGELAIPTPKKRREFKNKLSLKGCEANNLKGIDVSFPLGVFLCVTGVSGSGKSSLVIDTLFPTVTNLLRGRKPVNCKKVLGKDHINKIIAIDQSPIGRTPRSNPATYTGVFNPIRELFSKLPEARARGYKPGRFSFNVKGGRCEACEGAGVIRIEMHFLPDVYVQCDECKGKRYNRDTLEITYRGKTISDVLEMTVEDALHFFDKVPAIKSKLQTLYDVGLGYIKVGQRATTLSGGEAQRIKLAKELTKRSTGKTLYILDEPTTGLHFDDINKLLEVLNRLVDTGNTIVVIEHNLDVIKTADYIIDLGPEGGEGGGEVVAEGTPEAVAKIDESFTGLFLKRKLRTGRMNETKQKTTKKTSAKAKAKKSPAKKKPAKKKKSG